MENFFSTYGLFLAKSLTIVISTLVVFGGVVAIAAKNKLKPKERIEITKLNQKYKQMQETINSETLDKSDIKKLKKIEKQNKKANNLLNKTKPRIFVLDFDGDMKASSVENLREEITAILTAATPKDEVLVKIESGGGTIHGYGLGASQLKRIRNSNIPLTVCVDKVAASGGYMMASVADRILAAPFAILGSIGVIAQLPNFHRLLKKHDIEFEQVMAGEYKRTLSLFGENTKEGRNKLQQEVNDAHTLFKNFIIENRENIEIDTLSTGETWYGTSALEKNLIDEITTSDDYLLKASDKKNIFKVKYIIKKNVIEKIGISLQSTFSKFL